MAVVTRPCLPALAGLLLAGCSPGDFSLDTSPPAQAAEIVKTMVRSPDSFKRVGGEVVWQGKTRDGRPAYVTTVAFDSQNAFGAMLRGCMLVAYHEAQDGKLTWNPMFGIKDYTDEMPMLCQESTPKEIKAGLGKTFAEINFEGGKADPAA